MSAEVAPALYPAALPSRIERAARELYGVAQRHWVWRTAHDQGCPVCTSPAFLGWDAGFAEARHADGTCPLSHYLRFHITSVSIHYRGSRRGRRWQSIQERTWALWNEDQPPSETWSPLADDPNAWALDSEAQQGIDEWGGY